MKKVLIILGIVFLIMLILFVVVGGVAIFKAIKLMPSVESFIKDFYKQYNNRNFSYIYEKMSEKKFKSTNTYEDFEKMMAKIYQKMGAVKFQKKKGWTMDDDLSGVHFSIQYSITYERGNSVDSFVLKKYKDSWLLIDYDINSKELFY